MYIRRLEIENFRCFERAVAEFQFPGRTIPGTNEPSAQPGLENLNLILGDNGAGKSTVLKAIALAVTGRVLPSSGFRPYYLIRGGANQARVTASLELHPNDPHLREWAPPPMEGSVIQVGCEAVTCLERVGRENEFNIESTGLFIRGLRYPLEKVLSEQHAPAFFLCGYGANRRSEEAYAYDEAGRNKLRSPRYQRVAGLFEEQFSLTSFSAWVSRAIRRNPHVGFLLDRLEALMEWTGVGWTRESVEGEAEFRLVDGTRVPFSALSDGYRAFLAWIGDLLRHLSEVTPKHEDPGNVAGVVLVDEVDLHLHPRWQRQLLEGLARTFPRLQFIVTSHSPILAGSLPSENILVVERDPGGPAHIRLADDDLYGESVNRILVSPYFGLETTKPPMLDQLEREAREDRLERARVFLERGDEKSAKAYLEAIQSEAHLG